MARDNNSNSVEVGYDEYTGPVDLDELFQNELAAHNSNDQESLFGDDDDDEADSQFQQHEPPSEHLKYFNNPHKRLLDHDASLIPGSPFSKPALIRSNRPSEPLSIAKYTSTVAFLVTVSWVGVLAITPFFKEDKYSIGRSIVEVILALLSFFGLFWNSYYITAAFFKCLIPAKAFKTNTKYCSIIPEDKPERASWLDVTIQIPVYKESLHEVLMPTLKSCMRARDHYGRTTKARCNIVICDDGMMAMLRDNFPAAEMLWKSIQDSRGRVFRLSKLLKHVPRASRRHLKGLRSKDVYEVFHRMLYYYHYDIGFVARSTVDRRGKFKKASNLNSHLRLALGAEQRVQEEGGDLTMQQALLEESHNHDGSRYVMWGNDIIVGDLICVNDADARMAETVIHKTVPEFLNDPSLGFTQHATKTMDSQRGESYYTNMLASYTDWLYGFHFLTSSILGCHPPLVGHSIFLRTEALNQCGRMRSLRKAQRWLKNIGMPFIPVDQVGFSNLQANNRTEYWSESHVSEDFELMIHLYNLGFNGRYCAYPDCEFQEGITRTFDEEAGRHRKFALGAHELVFNPFQDMLGHGIFTPLFRTFLQCDIPSYYKVFLTAYLCSYTSGGCYLIVFTASALVRILDKEQKVDALYYFSPAGIIILNFIVYYLLGYITFCFTLVRMYTVNQNILFPEYRKRFFGSCRLVMSVIRYCFVFQFLFYNVAAFTFYFLGSMDHLMSRPGIVGATNKDSINISRCRAFCDMVKFNSGSWFVAFLMLLLAYGTILEKNDWDVTKYPDTKDEIIRHSLFAGPAAFLAIMAFLSPILLNPWILGWPFLRKPKVDKQLLQQQSSRRIAKKDALGREIVDINTFMNASKKLDSEIERAKNKPDVELGSLATKEISANSPANGRKHSESEERKRRQREDALNRMQPILETRVSGGGVSNHSSQQQQQQYQQQQQQRTRRSSRPTDRMGSV